jgi:PPOX class probable F420-dependent enzyme
VAGIALPQVARDLLESDVVAHVVTLDEDGGRQVTAAWVGLDGDEIVFDTLPDQRKLKNLRRDPRIALSIPSTTTNEWGLLEYLVVYGIARVTEGGASEVPQRLAHTNLGPTSSSRGCPIPRRGTSPRSRSSASAASGRGTHLAAERHGSRRARSPYS